MKPFVQLLRNFCLACSLLLSACDKEMPLPEGNRILSGDNTYNVEIEKYLAFRNISAERDVSGLYYRILDEGDGSGYMSPNSIPSVMYTYELTNGTTLHSSFGYTDFDGRQLKNHIVGWQIGLRKISSGGRIQLFIPPPLAYGAYGVPGLVPPNAVLITDVQLRDFR